MTRTKKKTPPAPRDTKTFTQKRVVSIKPWHMEYKRHGPGKMVITQTLRKKKNPAWYKPWEYIPTLVKEDVKIHKRKKTTPNRNLERLHALQEFHAEMENLSKGKFFRIPKYKPSAKNEY